MKKFLLFILFAAMAFPVLKAQPAMLGGGLAFSSGYHFREVNFDGNKSGNFALTFKHTHKISVPLEFSPTFSFFYPHIYKDVNLKETVTSFMIDIDGHYIFNALDRFEFYGLIGPDYIVAWNTTKVTSFTNGATIRSSEMDRTFGLNIGAGSYMKLTSQFDLYLELKYIVSKYGQFMANTGIMINIDWLKKHEAEPIN